MNDLNDLRKEFDNFVLENCDTGSCSTQEEEDIPSEELPSFADIVIKHILTPSISGVYLSRVDLKRISEATGDSVAIQQRKRMLKAMLRNRFTKKSLRELFDEVDKHINGKILIYKEIAESYPAASHIYESYISKAIELKKFLQKQLDDYTEIERTDEPLQI